jgi:hypothetical protein
VQQFPLPPVLTKEFVMNERAVSRLATDLQNGNYNEAASICRSELNADPQSALQDIKQANLLAGQNARMHIGTRHSDGDMAIVDQNGQVMTRIGNPYQQSQGYDAGFNNGQIAQRYPNQFPQDGNYPGQMPQRYPNQFPQDGNYPGQEYPGQFSQNGRYPGQFQQDGWQNGGFQNSQNQRMEVQRLAQDLAVGNTSEAAYLTQNLLQSPDGQRAIQSANQLADMEARQYGRYRAAEHAVPMRNGQEVILSDRGQILAGCGNIYEAQNMIGPSQFAPSPVNVSGNDGFNGGYNGAYFNGGYPPQTYPPQSYYPQQGYYNNGGNLASFGIGTAVGLTLSTIFRGVGGYHGRGRR